MFAAHIFMKYSPMIQSTDSKVRRLGFNNSMTTLFKQITYLLWACFMGVVRECLPHRIIRG